MLSLSALVASFRRLLSHLLPLNMDESEGLPPKSLKNSKVTKMQESTSSNQVVSHKASSMQRLVQVVHRMVEKSCRRACQFLCCPVDNMLCDKLTCCSAHCHQQQPAEDKTTEETAAPWCPPSTILIVNISNSTLIDCVIGKDAYPSTMAENQPLMQRTQDDQTRCSCSHRLQGAAETDAPSPHSPLFPSLEPSNISIHHSNLSCVIIGDNNYMQVEQIDPSEEEP